MVGSGHATLEVKWVIRKKGHYKKFSPELRFQIGKHAAENGVVATMRFYPKKFVLKESSVRTQKLPYGKRRSQPRIVGRAVLDRPSAKIRLWNLWRLPFRENWTPDAGRVLQNLCLHRHILHNHSLHFDFHIRKHYAFCFIILASFDAKPCTSVACPLYHITTN